jgi:ribosomal protein S7
LDEEGAERVLFLGVVSAHQGKEEVAEKILRKLLEDIEESLGRNNYLQGSE